MDDLHFHLFLVLLTLNDAFLLIFLRVFLYFSLHSGTDSDIEEGGAHIEWFWCNHAARAARANLFIFFARAYNALVPRARLSRDLACETKLYRTAL